MGYGTILAGLRKKCRYTQSEAAEYVSRFSKKACSFKVVSHWENGVSSPSVEQFLLLCELYGVRDIQRTFRGNGGYTPTEPPCRIIRLYDIPVAAGSGEFLDGDSYEEIEAGVDLPEGADFAVRVSGDSMAPRFADGQIIYIRKQPALKIGEVGIFALNGESYLKELGHGELISLNPRYGPIKIYESDSLHAFGRVLGRRK